MKKILFLCLMTVFVAACSNTYSTDNQSSEKEMRTASKGTPRYKMMGTENIHILLKWDTRTGKTWMVQYALSGTPAMEHLIPDSGFLDENESWNGRFELYPTRNMFNFIMIDTYNGDTYQVQWSIEEENRLAIPITNAASNQ